jgi:hypothetical protein
MRPWAIWFRTVPGQTKLSYSKAIARVGCTLTQKWASRRSEMAAGGPQDVAIYTF